MFTKILEWVKGVLKVFTKKDLSEKIGVSTIISQPMSEAIQLWSQMFENKAPWLNKKVKSMNIPAGIATEIARQVTIEMESTVTGSPRADYINSQYEQLIDGLRRYTEYAVAKGGLIFKPYVSGKEIFVDYIQADRFYPTHFDGRGVVTGGIFVDQEKQGENIFTRLELHTPVPGGWSVMNKVFVSKDANDIGRKAALNSINRWAELSEEVTYTGIEKPLFAYFRMPFANNIDTNSPLGVSAYSKAVGLIEEADKLYSNLLWEFESGERALYVDSIAFKKNPTTGESMIPTDKSRMYKVLDAGGVEDGFFKEWSPQFREQSIISGLNAILIKIEDMTGLARGTFSQPEAEARTATELKILKQRSYSTVADTQKSLEDALEHVVYIMDVYCDMYKLAPAGTYETTFAWDDSIVSDRDKQFAELQMLQATGVISKAKLYAWYFGTTEEEALKNIPAELPLFGGAQ